MKVVNSKRVGIADLKSRLSEHLRLVRKGGEITVMDRDKPIARILPYQEEPALAGLKIRPAKAPFNSFKPPPPLDPPVDALALLLEDRAKGRR